MRIAENLATSSAAVERPYKPSGTWTINAGPWFLLDASLGFVAMYMAYLFSPYSAGLIQAEGMFHLSRLPASLSFALILAIVAHILGLHNPLEPRQPWPMIVRCTGAVLTSLGVLSLLVFTVLYQKIGRYILGQSAVYTPLLMVALRLILWRVTGQRRRRVLLVGGGRAGRDLDELTRGTDVVFDVVGIVDHSREPVPPTPCRYPLLGPAVSLQSHCRTLHIDEVITCNAGKLAEESMSELMDCLGLGVRVSDFANFIERNFFQVPVEKIRGEWFLQADLELSHPAYLVAKRGTDILISLIGLVTFSPLFILAALAIKLESRGPVFYSQTRCGLHNRPFRIWKLRSMRIDAESDGPQWASAKDKRVTFVGRILRKTRLDEAPQFWNILRGEMSLVGPRPERPEFVAKLASEIPYYEQRHLVKPGLTGWAQINYPYGATTEDALCKLRYDLYYIKHASVALDLQIALRTIGVAMKGSR